MNNESKLVYQSGLVTLNEFDTPLGKRIMLDLGQDAVMIIPKFREKYIIVTQKRAGTNSITCEFPSGGIKSGELPLKAAIRELREETGSSGELSFFAKTEMLSGIVKFNLHIFIAEISKFDLNQQELDQGEELNVCLLSKEELFERIQTTNTVDSYLLLGFGIINIINNQNYGK